MIGTSSPYSYIFICISVKVRDSIQQLDTTSKTSNLGMMLRHSPQSHHTDDESTNAGGSHELHYRVSARLEYIIYGSGL